MFGECCPLRIGDWNQSEPQDQLSSGSEHRGLETSWQSNPVPDCVISGLCLLEQGTDHCSDVGLECWMWHRVRRTRCQTDIWKNLPEQRWPVRILVGWARGPNFHMETARFRKLKLRASNSTVCMGVPPEAALTALPGPHACMVLPIWAVLRVQRLGTGKPGARTSKIEFLL